MYSRYTEFRFEPADREAVLAFWETIAVPSASAQPGWRGAYILESDEHVGVLRTFTLWDVPADFERYRASDEHSKLGQGITSSGLRIDVRDGLAVRFHATPVGPLVRITRARFDAPRRDEVEAYWRSVGGPMMREATGCLRAEAYWADDGDGFTLVAEWASQEDAERFLASPDHRSFGATMDGFGSTVHERIVGARIG